MIVILGFISFSTFAAEMAVSSADNIIWVNTKVLKSEVPDVILKADPRAKDIPPDAYYEVSIGIHNDNVGKIRSGDDRGRTYGHYLHAAVITSKGIRFSFKYDEDLYTKNAQPRVLRSDGLYDTTQLTTAERVMKFVVSTREQGQLLYYTGALGWQQLDPSGSGPTADMQHEFHKLVKASRQTINVDGGSPKNSLLAEAAIGVQAEYRVNNDLKLKGNVEVGVSYSTAKDASSLNLKGEGAIEYKPNYFGFKLSAGVETKVFDMGVNYAPYVGADVLFGEKTSCGVRATKSMGDTMNYQLYNVPNVTSGEMDIMYTAGCTRKF